MQVATYRAADGRMRTLEYVDGHFLVEGRDITLTQVVGWDVRGALKWNSPALATWAASLRSASGSTGATSLPGTGVATAPSQGRSRNRVGKLSIAALAAVLLSLGAYFVSVGLPEAGDKVPSAGSVMSKSAETTSGTDGTGVSDATAAAAAATQAEPAPEPEPEPEPETAVVTIPATVIRVVDGDTAVFRLDDGTEEKTRFIGIDTPESTTKIEPYGKQASAYTAGILTPGRPVFLESDAEKRDKYGRLLAYVWLRLPDRITTGQLRLRMLNAKLAAEGYAQQMTIPPNVKYADHFRALVAQARDSSKGLWADSDAGESPPVAAPSAPSPGTTGGSSGQYIGNNNTWKFHLLNCTSVPTISSHHVVVLHSRQEALGAGYVPCKRCNP